MSVRKGAGHKQPRVGLGEELGSSPEQELMNKPYHTPDILERHHRGL